MERVAEKKQQRKILGGKKEVKSKVCIASGRKIKSIGKQQNPKFHLQINSENEG